jgi:hypothetical protein
MAILSTTPHAVPSSRFGAAQFRRRKQKYLEYPSELLPCTIDSTYRVINVLVSENDGYIYDLDAVVFG